MSRARRTVVALLAGALLIPTSLPVEEVVAAGGGPKCYVRLNEGTLNSGNGGILTRALKNAKANDTFHIGGTCGGNFAVPATTVTLVADLTGLVPVEATTGTLSAGGKGTVLTVPSGATVTIRGLTVRDGAAPSGGGIVNAGTLTLTDGTVVTGNAAVPNRSSTLGQGGGIHNTGTLTIGGTATVRSNSARYYGGGIHNGSSALLTLEGDAVVRDNTGGTGTGPGVPQLQGGGGIYSWDGAIVLRGRARVSGNYAGIGGGIFSRGALTIQDDVAIAGNRALLEGGGIEVYQGSATIGGRATVTGNRADGASVSVTRGGGIYVGGGATVSITDGVTVAGNSAVGVASSEGGAIVNDGTLTISGASLTDNSAGTDLSEGYGGAVYNYGTLTLLGGSVITGNVATADLYEGYQAAGGVFNDGYYGDPGAVHACSVVGLDSSTGTNNSPNDWSNYLGTWDTTCP